MKQINNYSLTLGWLYPELMSTYGDRGNVIILKKRAEWRGINLDIKQIDFKTESREIEKCDLIFGGGAQDRQQAIVIEDMRKNKGPVLKERFSGNVPGLFVCGSPQLLGHNYQTGDGKILEGLGIFDMETKHFGKDKPRCIGNIICNLNTNLKTQISKLYSDAKSTIVGFENHGGRTYLGTDIEAFATVIYGFGNNGEDKTEGAVYKNCIATYMHGPFLTKNPHIADWLTTKALEIKYKKQINLEQLDDSLEWQAHEKIIYRILK